MKNIKKIALIFGLMAFGFMATGAVDNLVSDDSTAQAIFTGKKVNQADVNTNTDSKALVTGIFKFANVFAGIVLAVSIVMIVLGGLRYITANGDPKAVEQGKMILIYSGIGIIIALSAFALGRFFVSFAV